jgi:hypothetical protein
MPSGLLSQSALSLVKGWVLDWVSECAWVEASGLESDWVLDWVLDWALR